LENIEMRARFIACLLLGTSGLLIHTATYADILRCVGRDGGALFTNMACPTGMRGTTIITSPACTTAECQGQSERDTREASERARAEKERLEIDAEERRGREEEAAPETPLQGEATEPEVAIPYDPVNGTANPSYPVLGAPSTVIILPSHHHRHHGMNDRDHDRDRHQPMKDPKDPHKNHSAEPERHPQMGQANNRHWGHSAAPEEPKPASQAHSSPQVVVPHPRADTQCRDRVRCAAPGAGPSNGRGKS
jgi:hypothetical protein